MYYWIVIVFVIATMLGLNLSKKDDYRDTVLMPKIEPVISRAVTQHTAAYKYFQDSYVANADNIAVEGSEWEKDTDLSSKIVPKTEADEYGNQVPVVDAKGNQVYADMTIKQIKVSNGSDKGEFKTALNSNTSRYGSLGKDELAQYAPYGFDFTNRDPKYDPVTRFVCIDRDSGNSTKCNSLVLNKVNDAGKYDPEGKFKTVGYLVTYMPIPSMWDTPYYHNMIVNSIKRISDNTLRFGIVKPLITSGGSPVTVNESNVMKFTARESSNSKYEVTKNNLGEIYTVGVPNNSSRAIYTVLDEVAVTGRRKEGITSSNLIGVFTFVPGQIAAQAKIDFPDRACDKGKSSDKRDVNGMLMFIHRITPLENETLPDTVTAADLLIPSTTPFCPYASENNDDDAFYDASGVLGDSSKKQ